MTVLEPDELVTGIHYPAWPQGHVTLFREVAQRPGDFALVGMVGALALEGGKIARAGIAWFGMGPTPIEARAGRSGADRQAHRCHRPAGHRRTGDRRHRPLR